MEQTQDPPIVGIGASAGGVRALQTFFQHIPPDTGAAFVVILHLAPDAHSELSTIVASRTAMPVEQVEDSPTLQANHVYVIAPNRRLRIADHTISALPFDEPRGQRAPIDLFFRSLADQNSNAYAVVLTGAGSDGALGVRFIKEAGGIVLVQDPIEAEYASMPRSAIATEVADVVLPVRQLAERLTELLRTRSQMPPAQLQDTDEDHLRRILAHVRVRTGHDFTQYKRATIMRRIARRVQVTRKESLAEYYAYLRDTAEEAQALFGDFLISVTTFFRDPDAFAALAVNVIPSLFEGKEVGDAIRVWVPGCATGEEAYSIGILLLEEAARRDLRPEIQVFGSDLDAGALSVAREGRYPAAIESDLSEERLRRFFIREGDHYQVRRELRDIVLFASHNLLKDPPFSRLDMITCRNLLIYLDREPQQQVCSMFHYALHPGGYLFLGSSETADVPGRLFRVVDRDARIYRALEGAGDKRLVPPLLLHSSHVSLHAYTTPPSVTPSGTIGDAALHRQMLERIAPPSILVDETHRAVHLSETAGRFLQPAGGPATTDAIDMVRPELRFDLRSALHRAFENDQATLSMPILVQFNGAPHRVFLHVKPVPQEGERRRFALVLFIEGEAVQQNQDAGIAYGTSAAADETVRQLQEELQLTRNRLRATREEAEATNEELRAANEELQSINEEYRSTSEELETSKEELQSINEELQTVNNELKLKLESVSRAHSDLQNLMAATDFGTLFLDPSLRIKRFTPRLTDLFNVTTNDEGRPITDFTHQLDYDGISSDAQAVLRDLTPVERVVQSRNGHWYLARTRPYRTVDDKIDGVVATFVDITDRRRAEEALLASEDHLRQEMRLIELSHSPIYIWDFDGGVVQWNRGSEELYGYMREEIIGKRKDDVLQTSVPGAPLDVVRQALIDTGQWSGELQHRTKDGRILTVEAQLELMTSGERRLVLESTHDISDRKRWEDRQRLLLSELTHRVRNTLTVVQSIARQTLRTAPTSDEFVKRFEGRLLALAEAHRLLIDSDWKGAELQALVQSQLRAYIASDPRRVRLSGEPVTLVPDIATPFGLILHELGTNAAKHGALSQTNGYVDLSWKVTLEDHRRKLTVVWRECDGPPVAPPETQGVGSSLIARGLPGATVRHEMLSDGVMCTIEVMLPEMEDGANNE